VPRFLSAAFCVLARLSSLQGGHEAGGGMQLACPHTLFDVLASDLNVRMELFASPLNTRFPTFCSAAHDVDHPVGSCGSFFRTTLLSGAYLANPPFEPGLVLSMAQRMAALLAAADAHDRSLTFVAVVPKWSLPRGPHLPAWTALREAAHVTCAMVLPKATHVYVDQHGKAVPARHDSSLIVLQSAAAARNVSVSDAMQARIRAAFAHQGRGPARAKLPVERATG